MNIVKVNPIELKQEPNYKTVLDDKLLEDSVAAQGQKLPIVVTLDGVVIRGARLRDACFKAGKVSVTCVVVDLTYNEWVKGSYDFL